MVEQEQKRISGEGSAWLGSNGNSGITGKEGGKSFCDLGNSKREDLLVSHYDMLLYKQCGEVLETC